MPSRGYKLGHSLQASRSRGAFFQESVKESDMHPASPSIYYIQYYQEIAYLFHPQPIFRHVLTFHQSRHLTSVATNNPRFF
jgi:hypothetical protein